MTEPCLKILIVEDVRDHRIMLTDYFTGQMSCEVVPVASADEAINLLRVNRNSYDIVSLDLDLRQAAGNYATGLDVLAVATAGSSVRSPGIVVISGALEDQDFLKYLETKNASELVASITRSGIRLKFIPKNQNQTTFLETLAEMLTIKDLEILADRTPPPSNVFARLNKKMWRLQFAGRDTACAHTEGMIVIRELLDKPDQSLSALTLCQLLDLPSTRPPNGREGEIPGSVAKAAERVDRRAIGEYKEDFEKLLKEIGKTDLDIDAELPFGERDKGVQSLRLKRAALKGKLEEVIEGIKKSGLLPRKWVLPDENGDWGNLESELQKKLHRRNRGQADPRLKNAQSRIKKNYERALREIESAHPELATYLRKSIHTGYSCRYDSDKDVKWELA